MPHLPLIVRTLPALRRNLKRMRNGSDKIALVPTMGALHAGHIALVRLARRRARRVMVSIFVNPAQFGPNEDFTSYPRAFDADIAALAQEAVDAVWAPAVNEMYRPGFATRVVPESRSRTQARTSRGAPNATAQRRPRPRHVRRRPARAVRPAPFHELR